MSALEPQPTVGPSIRIEPLEPRHAADLFDALNHASVGQYIGGPDVTTCEALVERITRLQMGPPAASGQVWINFAVVLDHRAIGRVEATVRGESAEIAYLLGPRYGGRGFATFATALLIVRLRELGVQTLWACVHPDNVASQRLLARLDFSLVPAGAHPELASFDDGDLVFRADVTSTRE